MMNPLFRAVKVANTLQKSQNEAKHGARSMKNEKNGLNLTQDSQRGGGGLGSSTDAEEYTLIQPEKKCHKGAFREDELADRMGIARNTLRTIRKKHLTKGKHWIMDGNAVLLLQTAIDSLLRHLNLQTNDIPKETSPHLLQVTKFWANKRMLGCIDPSCDNQIIQVVWVRDSAMFKPNQIVPVKWQKGRLVLACRQPKTKGLLK
jgi:hypothetical protein